MPDPEMIIRVCDMCEQPRVLEHYFMEAATMPGPFINTHHFSAKCGCGTSMIGDSDIAPRPDLFRPTDGPSPM